MWLMQLCMWFLLLGVTFPSAAQTSQTPSPDGTRLMYRGWPTLDVLAFDCKASLLTGKETGFACELPGDGDELRVFIGEWFTNDPDKAAKARRDRLELVSWYVFAGGSRIVFVDATQKPPLAQNCTRGRRGFQCDNWREWQ